MTLKIGIKNMQAKSVLRFEFSPSEDTDKANNGYGMGILYVNEEPYWYADKEGKICPIEWTWIDLLEHISNSWLALIAEQSYPFEWLSKTITHPGQIWETADLRWLREGDEVADREDPIIQAFLKRHNLAYGWKGLSLPALEWLRTGNQLYLSIESGEQIIADFQSAAAVLERFGNDLSEAFSHSKNCRVMSAIESWKARHKGSEAHFLEIATGLNSDAIKEITGENEASEYWSLRFAPNGDIDVANDNEYLAAARMTAGILKPSQIANIINILKSKNKTPSIKLDALTREALPRIENFHDLQPYQSGYGIAGWLINKLNHNFDTPLDILSLIAEFEIEIAEESFQVDHIQAVAAWGACGPCIVLNKDRRHSSEKPTRMILAHEFCHLIIDRTLGLPAADVIGGKVDRSIESRANAFAAELLAPRSVVEKLVIEIDSGDRSINNTVQTISKKLNVSKSVICNQIHNSETINHLTQEKQNFIKRQVNKKPISEENALYSN